jgi:mono/diheme cytochrome c family protein
MPSSGDAYSDAEIAAIANYVTARFGCKAVAAHRAERGGAKEASRRRRFGR